MRFQPQVPLAEVCGRVTGVFQYLSQRGNRGIQSEGRPNVGALPVRQTAFVRGGNEANLWHVSRGFGYAVPRRILAAHDAGARRRAGRAGCVGIRERQAARCESFNIRGFIQRSLAVERGVGPAEIVGQDQDDVGTRT